MRSEEEAGRARSVRGARVWNERLAHVRASMLAIAICWVGRASRIPRAAAMRHFQATTVLYDLISTQILLSRVEYQRL